MDFAPMKHRGNTIIVQKILQSKETYSSCPSLLSAVYRWEASDYLFLRSNHTIYLFVSFFSFCAEPGFKITPFNFFLQGTTGSHLSGSLKQRKSRSPWPCCWMRILPCARPVQDDCRFYCFIYKDSIHKNQWKEI